MHQPYKFASAKDPTIVKEWLEVVESVLALYDMSNQETIIYASYLFKATTQVWQNLTSEKVKDSTMTWVEFGQLFKTEYKGANVTCIRAQEFITLSQGSDSKKEYANRFNNLVRMPLGK